MPAIVDLVPLDRIDPAALDALLDRAFGADRRARTAYRLREGMTSIDAFSFAAVEEGRLIGSVQCWPIALADDDGAAIPLVLVGPVAVDPARQRDGVGRRLTSRALAAAEAAGEDAFALIGDPDYYGRFFGFDATPTAGWRVPGPVDRHRLLARLVGGRTLPTTGALGPRRPD